MKNYPWQIGCLRKPAGKEKYYSGLHALRAVAAMLVVFQHAYYTACISRSETYSNEFPINFGRLGVVLFFSISGFVIALNRTKPVKQFILHRVLRIYPGYWLAIILTVLLLQFSGYHAHVSIEAALLWPAAHETDLKIPYWTLVFEVVFYFVAAVWYLARLNDRILSLIAVTWILVINFLPLLSTPVAEFTSPGKWILFSPIIQVLPMGFLCALNLERLRMVPRFGLISAAVLAYVLSFCFPDYTASRHLFLGICTTLFVALGAGVESKNTVLEILGNASYGLYLMHFPVILLISWYLPVMPLFVATALFLAIGTVMGTLFGVFDYRLYCWNTMRSAK
jgi:peptidoglycan/LPS O-acetylase OafA/YrhL